MTDFLYPLEGQDPPRIDQAKILLRAVTYKTQDMVFDRFVDKPDQKVVVCEVWTPGESGQPGDEWMHWFGVSYDRLEMEDFYTAVLLTMNEVQNTGTPSGKITDEPKGKE